jgi:sulfonate transport system permease protein
MSTNQVTVLGAPLPADAAPVQWTAPGRRTLVAIEPRKSKQRWRVPRPVRRVLGPAALVVLWWVLSASGVLNARVLPSPQAVVAKFGHLIANGQLPSAILASSQRVLYGFAIGAFLGIGLALLAGLFRLGEDVIDSTMGMLRTLPWVALSPMFTPTPAAQ